MGVLVAAIGAAGIWLLAVSDAQKPMAASFRRLTFQDGYVMRALFVPRSKAILFTAAWDAGSLGT